MKLNWNFLGDGVCKTKNLPWEENRYFLELHGVDFLSCSISYSCINLLFSFQDAGLYLKNLIPPVLTCFYDQDSRVRYYACEALYNIAKVTRGSVLAFFNDVFDGLSKVSILKIILKMN